MKLAMRLPEKGRQGSPASDPREEMGAEIIDLASRTAYPVVAQRKGKSDALALAGGIGFVAVLGAATLWGLNASRLSEAAPEQPSAVAPEFPLGGVQAAGREPVGHPDTTSTGASSPKNLQPFFKRSAARPGIVMRSQDGV